MGKEFCTPSKLEYKARKVMNGQGIWKFLVTALLSISVTMAAGWVIVGKDFNELQADVVTERDVIYLIERHSPYKEDKKLLDQLPSQIQKVFNKLEMIGNRITKLETKVDLIIDKK
jgi:hypothetical protein